MPGLMRGMVRTAAVVGTATATRGAVNRRQASKNAQAQAAYAQPAAYAPAPAPAPMPTQPVAETFDPISQLERLGALHAQGILTDDEFASEKAKVLAM